MLMLLLAKNDDRGESTDAIKSVKLWHRHSRSFCRLLCRLPPAEWEREEGEEGRAQERGLGRDLRGATVCAWKTFENCPGRQSEADFRNVRRRRRNCTRKVVSCVTCLVYAYNQHRRLHDPIPLHWHTEPFHTCMLELLSTISVFVDLQNCDESLLWLNSSAGEVG